MKRLIVFDKNDNYEEYLIFHNAIFNEKKVIIENNLVFFETNFKKLNLDYQKKYQDGNKIFTVLNNERKEYKINQKNILIGQKNSDIWIAKGKYVIKDKIISKDIHANLYINGILIKNLESKFEYGDRIMLENFVELIVKEKTIIICSISSNFKSNLEEINVKNVFSDNFPNYTRSPRIVKRTLTNEVEISNPPSKIERTKGSLARVIIPPIIMGAGTVAMSLTMGRSNYIYSMLFLAGTFATVVFSLTSFFQDKKDIRIKNEKRIKVYEKYLLKKRKELYKLKLNEINAWEYNFPKIETIVKMSQNYSSRIYERDFNDYDFLILSIGYSNQNSEYEVKFKYDELSTEKDPLVEEAKLIQNSYSVIENKPNTIDLKNAHLGIVGEKQYIHKQLKLILSQLTFFHSYHDLQIIYLYSGEYKNDFDYIKWYPHLKLQGTNLSGNIYNERIKDQVLGSLFQILKERKVKLKESRNDEKFHPHYVIIVDDYNLIANHSIMEFLQDDKINLGFTLIFTSHKKYSLPENIKTVLSLEDKTIGKLLINEGVEVNKKVNLEQIEDIKLENTSRKLAALNHLKGMRSQIPSKVSFFDLYNVDSPEKLNILQRWNESKSYRSLSVPLGFRSKEEIVNLNLHEKAHGPHGLVAGTTGSGKSEVIQSYILSLAVNFSPYEVGFLLIDYKGGGMANLFKKLPHLLGTITNLDGSESMRALSSIKAELKRRQKLFNLANVNNINLYTKLFRSGKVKEPLPHLFIISDEFAELKKEQPEFMSELVSVARIGRTLGVHLILATQRPTGVVDDQIWSNSKFKLALKVQNESDSKEILKTPDAAFISKAGRAYLQVGNNEIYELFQSAWSGAPYVDINEKNSLIDNRIFEVNDIGQGILVNTDLSKIHDQEDNMKTQLDVVVNYIYELNKKTSNIQIRKTWLPNLEKIIVSPHIENIVDTNLVKEIDLKFKLGLVDIPEQQKQSEYEIDLIKNGSFSIYGSSGFGKSTTMGTIITSLAVKNNPTLLNMYILDFGNGSLIPFAKMPHVADYITFDNFEKLEKFQKLILDEMKKRKQLLSKEMVQNFDIYNKAQNNNKMNSIIIYVDNFDVIRELGENFEAFFIKITRDGPGLGIYTIITASRPNAIRFAILNNFSKQISHYIYDENEIVNIIGRSEYKLKQIPGRAILKDEYVSLMQVYLAVYAKDGLEYINSIKKVIENISDKYSGPKLYSIPTLPEIFTSQDFPKYKNETTGKYVIGLSTDEVENISANITNSPYAIIGPSQSGKTNALKILISQNIGEAVLIDSNEMNLFEYSKNPKYKYLLKAEEVIKYFENLKQEVEIRKQKLEQGLSSGKYASNLDYINDSKPLNIYIEDVTYLHTILLDKITPAKVLVEAVKLNINVIATMSSTKWNIYDDFGTFFKSATNGLVLGNMLTIPIFVVPVKNKYDLGEGFIVENGTIREIKIPIYIPNNKK